MTWAEIALIAIIATVYLLIRRGGHFKFSYKGLGQEVNAEYDCKAINERTPDTVSATLRE
jgi:hypothetical protein